MESYLSDLARTEALALETADELNSPLVMGAGSDENLRSALEVCISARALIPNRRRRAY